MDGLSSLVDLGRSSGGGLLRHHTVLDVDGVFQVCCYSQIGSEAASLSVRIEEQRRQPGCEAVGVAAGTVLMIWMLVRAELCLHQ